MKFFTQLFCAALLCLSANSSFAGAMALDKSVMDAAVASLGSPKSISPIKVGDSIFAVVWRYDESSGGEHVAVIVMDGAAKSIIVNGQPIYYLRPVLKRSALDLRIPRLGSFEQGGI